MGGATNIREIGKGHGMFITQDSRMRLRSIWIGRMLGITGGKARRINFFKTTRKLRVANGCVANRICISINFSQKNKSCAAKKGAPETFKRFEKQLGGVKIERRLSQNEGIDRKRGGGWGDQLYGDKQSRLSEAEGGN